MADEEDDPGPSADQMASIVIKEFRGRSDPATVEMVANVYALMFQHQETVLELYRLFMAANPDMVFTDQVQSLRRSLAVNASDLVERLRELAESEVVIDGGKP